MWLRQTRRVSCNLKLKHFARIREILLATPFTYAFSRRLIFAVPDQSYVYGGRYGAPFVSKLFLVTGETERNIDLILRPKSQNTDPIFRQISTRFSAKKSTRFCDKNQPDSLRSIIGRCGQRILFATRSCSVLYSLSFSAYTYRCTA